MLISHLLGRKFRQKRFYFYKQLHSFAKCNYTDDFMFEFK